jgi:uncharacterized protein with GYD domain
MPKYRISGNYTTSGISGVMAEGGSARREAVVKLAESVGGSVESFYFAFGADDSSSPSICPATRRHQP